MTGGSVGPFDGMLGTSCSGGRVLGLLIGSGAGGALTESIVVLVGSGGVGRFGTPVPETPPPPIGVTGVWGLTPAGLAGALFGAAIARSATESGVA
ncbi:hypothetical protein SPAR_04770 [Streptomyces sparsogenes DSM 40356]|uniref:Uncharacterized protein n=1 Tax=Streptomyces sparsogenes DSM 40356 TaxID=1331668 RepID=A0A1R1SQX0_9ACTN|nr:hypothetical protein SPAR_04770 [Streptomyces sparsogenes DSM 40356]